MLRHDFELRDLEWRGKGRTLILACVPFDQPTWVADDQGEYMEVFRRGAFAGVTNDPRRTKLQWQHKDDPLSRLGSGVELREDAAYLIGHFRVVNGQIGDQVVSLVNDGELTGVSIGFVAGQDQRSDTPDGPLVERLRVKQLPEVSLVDEPAYSQARVLDMRAARAAEERRAALRAYISQMRAFVG